MSRHNLWILGLCLAGTVAVQAASIVEKDGRFEINWSTGKVRYYGTAMLNQEQDSTWRAVEQRAWSDGLSYLQNNINTAMANKSGVQATSAEKLTNTIASTASTQTTYFGDSRIKVALETPIVAAVKPTLDAAAGHAIAGASTGGLVIRVKARTTPSVVLSVTDESGSELVAAKDLAASATQTGTVARWYKSSAAATDATANSEKTAEIEATSPKHGVLKVSRDTWKPEYASLLASGRAVIVIQ